MPGRRVWPDQMEESMIATNDGKPNVTVMHPDPLMAIGLATSLMQRQDINVFLSGQTAAGQAIDVVLTNYEEGLKLAAGMARNQPRILVVAVQEREQEVRIALEAGVHGYLLLGCKVEEVVEGIHALASGRRYMCMSVAQRIADSMSREALTSRETDVLELLADGHCNKSIARQLDIAVGTVKAHVKGILSKLDASSRTQAVSIAVTRGLVGVLQPAHASARRSGGVAVSA
jgi:DNA-binding NarL/FixJ family response regulator